MKERRHRKGEAEWHSKGKGGESEINLFHLLGITKSKEDGGMIQIGDKVKDVVTGYAGIVIARTEYLNGCVQFGVKADTLKDGAPIDAQWLDENQLIVVEAGKVPAFSRNSQNIETQRTGGPAEAPRL